MSPNPAPSSASEPDRSNRSDRVASLLRPPLDDLGYECAMPHLWVGAEEQFGSPADDRVVRDQP
jgi:hypothetical protein